VNVLALLMSRTLHDEFAKDWMKEFLSDFGKVETEFEIASEIRSVDVYFQPDRELSNVAAVYNQPEFIGRLARLITKKLGLKPPPF
jgi:hypothetical protein